MAGRAQAANLTGMLGQIAETVGEMGKASDWTHENIRTLAAPDIKDGSFESLSEYADWAQRNGKQEVADRYRALALAQQQKNKKGAYAQQVAQTQEKIRQIDGGIAALEATVSPTNPLGGPRKPMQPAPNGGFRRPPGAPQQAPAMGNGQREQIIAQRLQEMKAQRAQMISGLNTLGADNVNFGGTGVEGSQFNRALATERTEAERAAVKAQQGVVNLAGSTIDLNERLEEPAFKQQQTLYRNAYDEQFARTEELKDLAKNGNATVITLAQEAEAKLDAIESEWQKWGDGQTLTGDYTAATYAEKAEKDFIAERRAQVTERINQDTAAKTEAAKAGVNIYDAAVKAGRTEYTNEDLVGQHPESIRIAQNLMTERRASGERVKAAGQAGSVTDAILNTAKQYAAVRPEIALALKNYEEATSPDTAMTDTQKNGAAANLQSLVEGYINGTAAAVEAQLKNVSIDNWYNTFKEEASWWNGTDISDGITDENRAQFNQGVRDAMLVDGKMEIETADEFAYYARLSRTAMGLETDPGVLAGVATAAGNNEVRNRTYTEALVDLRAGIAAKNPKFTPDMVEYHAQKIAKKTFKNFDIFFDLDHRNQLETLKMPHQPNDPQQMHTLFNNDKALIDKAIAYMQANPGVILNYNHFLEQTVGE